MKKTVDKIPFYRLGWNNSYLCIKSIILHFAARIVILMPEALAEGIKTIRAAKCNLCS
jgi:hypothetical protein